jgi:DNA-binding MarR family transcriptional regulator
VSDSSTREREAAPEYIDAVRSLLTLHRYLRRSSKMRAESGISGKQHATLRLLEAGSRTIGELSRLLFTGDSATSELVAKLEKDGLVQRRRADEDNRIVRVSITESGREVADRTPLAGMPLLRERLLEFSAEELRAIHDSVRTVLDALELSDE